MCGVKGADKNGPRWKVVKYCLHCGALLVQREDEPNHNWIKRLTCNKAHGALAKQAKIRAEQAGRLKTEGERSGLVTYIPGSPEFEAIASLYR